MPVRYVASTVPTPAPVPLRPLTDATEPLGYRSAGRFRIIVDSAAYANVAIATHTVSPASEVADAAGIRNSIAAAEKTMTIFRAAPTDQPRLISALEQPPPKKFPQSAA